MSDADLLLVGRVVTVDDTRRVIENGAVAVRDGVIVAVGVADEVRREWTARETIAKPASIIMPGMIDCHTHSAQALVRSLIAGELPMIQRLYLPGEDAMTLGDVELSSELLMAQLLRSGVTCFAETVATPGHEDAILGTVDRVGMRCIAARGTGDQDFAHAAIYSQVTQQSWARTRGGQAASDLEVTARFLDAHPPRGGGLIRGSILASHVTSFSADYFRLAHELAIERDAVLSVHVARDREEVEFSLAVFGARPIERLAQLGVISEHLLAIHAILATDREIDLLAAGGAAVAHQPAETLNILNGVPPVARMRARGIRVGLGCDNAINDGWEMMRVAAALHTALRGIPDYDPEHLPAEAIFDMATRDAARALSWDDAIGSIEVGKQADLVVLDGTGPHAFPVQHPVVDLVRYGTRAEVSDVFVAGRQLLRDRQLTTIDLEKLRRETVPAAERARVAITPRRYRPLAPGVTLD